MTPTADHGVHRMRKKTDSGHCLTSSRVLYKGVLKPGHDLGAISRAVLDVWSRFVV